MIKKRTSLESLFEKESSSAHDKPKKPSKVMIESSSDKLLHRPHVKQQTVYLPIPVYEQLRKLAFEERKKMHDYILEGLDLIFEKKGLASIKEIKSKDD